MKASDILLEAPEEIHMTDHFDDLLLKSTAERVSSINCKPKRYCALGLLRCKGGYYESDKRYDYEAWEKAGLPKTALDTVVSNPVTKEYNSLFAVIVELNDTERWTFKQIGEWLRGLGY